MTMAQRVIETIGRLSDRLNQLYPKVDGTETPLPRSWSTKDKFTYIGLSQGNLRVHYKGTSQKKNSTYM